MADLRELRNRRLNNEYKELMRINGKIINIEPIGNAPYEKYKITFNIRTIISPAPTYRNSTVCKLTIPPNYPEEAPTIVAENTPYPWHINWYPKSGRWCFGSWNKEESLVNYLHRCARTLQFEPEMANPSSMANPDAIVFWNLYKNERRVIPCDTQVLPTLESPENIIINNREKPQIIFKPQADKPKIIIRN